MIPGGWQYRSLEELASIKRGKFSARPRNDPRYYGGNTPFVQTGDVVAAKKYLTRYSQTLNDDGVGVSKVFPPDTILITIAANIGATAITTFPVACPDSVVGINPLPKAADCEWLKAILESKQPELDAQATQNAQKNINLEVLKPLQILAPPFPEQQSIGDANRTWDHAIETVEALIANVRAQKQAMMQQLLPQRTTPPKKRLPGFSGEWREVRLGNLVKEVSRDVEWDDEATYKLISVRRRSEGIFHRESLLGHEILTKAMKVALAGDFLISKMQIVHGASALVKGDFDGFNISGSYIALVPKDQAKLDIEYFDWYSRTPYFYKLAYISSYGVHIEKMTFNLKSFLKQTILVPRSKAEQSAIVDRLNSAEALIGVYQSQASALRQEKAALMQQLLTGKRRVKLPESENA